MALTPWVLQEYILATSDIREPHTRRIINQLHDDTVREIARVIYFRTAAKFCNYSRDVLCLNISKMIHVYEENPHKVWKLLLVTWYCICRCVSRLLRDKRFVTSSKNSWKILDEMKFMVINLSVKVREDLQESEFESFIEQDIWNEVKSIIILSVVYPNHVWADFIEATQCIRSICRDRVSRLRILNDIINVAKDALAYYGILAIPSFIEEDIRGVLE